MKNENEKMKNLGERSPYTANVLTRGCTPSQTTRTPKNTPHYIYNVTSKRIPNNQNTKIPP